MRMFDIKDPKGWDSVEAGQVLLLPCPSATRRVHLRFNTDEPVSVFISDTPDMEVKTLAAHDYGMFEVKAVISSDAYFVVHAPEGATIGVASQIGQSLVKTSDKPTFTSLRPMVRANDMDRLMFLQRENQKRQDAVLKKAMLKIEELAAQNAAPVIETPKEDPQGDLSQETPPAAD